MLTFIKKVQQDYIAAKLKDQKTYWFDGESNPDTNDQYVMIALDQYSLYIIPSALLYIKLADGDRAPGLSHVAKCDGYQPAKFNGTTPEGLQLFEVDGTNILADPKRTKPFLAVKGVRVMGKGALNAIQFYTENGKFLGCVMPIRPKSSQE